MPPSSDPGYRRVSQLCKPQTLRCKHSCRDFTHSEDLKPTGSCHTFTKLGLFFCFANMFPEESFDSVENRSDIICIIWKRNVCSVCRDVLFWTGMSYVLSPCITWNLYAVRQDCRCYRNETMRTPCTAVGNLNIPHSGLMTDIVCIHDGHIIHSKVYMLQIISF